MSAPFGGDPPRSPGRPVDETTLFPGPLAALLITLAGLVATALVAVLLDFGSTTAAVGIGEALGLGGVASLAALRVPEPQAQRLGLQGFRLQLLSALLGLLPIVFLLSELDNCVRSLIPPSSELQELVNETLQQSDSVYAWLERVIVLLGISPLVESFLFAGVLLQGLAGRLGSLRGVLLTALLYTLVHAPQVPAPGDAVVPLISALCMGALLALARLATGSILASALVVGGFSCIHLVALPAANWLPVAGFNAAGEHTPLWVLVPSSLALTWALRRLLAAARERPMRFGSEPGGDGLSDRPHV